MYYNGYDVAQDYKQAFSWFKKSAEQGFANAQCKLGVMYDEGKGVAQDYKQAFSWYKKSAEQGYAYAQLQLGGMYFNGKGVAKDDKQSSYWYNKAADHEDESAVQFLIAKMYYNGMMPSKTTSRLSVCLKNSQRRGFQKLSTY